MDDQLHAKAGLGSDYQLASEPIRQLAQQGETVARATTCTLKPCTPVSGSEHERTAGEVHLDPAGSRPGVPTHVEEDFSADQTEELGLRWSDPRGRPGNLQVEVDAELVGLLHKRRRDVYTLRPVRGLGQLGLEDFQLRQARLESFNRLNLIANALSFGRPQEAEAESHGSSGVVEPRRE